MAVSVLMSKVENISTTNSLKNQDHLEIEACQCPTRYTILTWRVRPNNIVALGDRLVILRLQE